MEKKKKTILLATLVPIGSLAVIGTAVAVPLVLLNKNKQPSGETGTIEIDTGNPTTWTSLVTLYKNEDGHKETLTPTEAMNIYIDKITHNYKYMLNDLLGYYADNFINSNSGEHVKVTFGVTNIKNNNGNLTCSIQMQYTDYQASSAEKTVNITIENIPFRFEYPSPGEVESVYFNFTPDLLNRNDNDEVSDALKNSTDWKIKVNGMFDDGSSKNSGEIVITHKYDGEYTHEDITKRADNLGTVLNNIESNEFFQAMGLGNYCYYQNITIQH